MCTWIATSFSARRLADRGEQLAHVVERDAELVDPEAGRDVRVALRVDVGIDAERDACGRAEPRRDRFDARELADRLDVDRLEAQRHGALELGGRLADAGEDDVGRRKPGLARQLDLPDGVRVGGAAELAQRARETERGIGLERVVQAVRMGAESGVDRTIAIAQHRGAVHVDRGPFRFSDRRQWNAVAYELLGSAEETDHDDV